MAGARRTPTRGLGEPDFLGILVAASHNTIFQVGLAMLEDLINQQWQALARLIRESKALGQLKLKALIARKKRRRKPSLADAIGKRRKANALEEYRRRFSPAARDAIPAPASLPATAQGFREPPQPPLERPQVLREPPRPRPPLEAPKPRPRLELLKLQQPLEEPKPAEAPQASAEAPWAPAKTSQSQPETSWAPAEAPWTPAETSQPQPETAWPPAEAPWARVETSQPQPEPHGRQPKRRGRASKPRNRNPKPHGRQPKRRGRASKPRNRTPKPQSATAVRGGEAATAARSAEAAGANRTLEAARARPESRAPAPPDQSG